MNETETQLNAPRSRRWVGTMLWVVVGCVSLLGLSAFLESRFAVFSGALLEVDAPLVKEVLPSEVDGKQIPYQYQIDFCGRPFLSKFERRLIWELEDGRRTAGRSAIWQRHKQSSAAEEVFLRLAGQTRTERLAGFSLLAVPGSLKNIISHQQSARVMPGEEIPFVEFVDIYTNKKVRVIFVADRPRPIP